MFMYCTHKIIASMIQRWNFREPNFWTWQVTTVKQALLYVIFNNVFLVFSFIVEKTFMRKLYLIMLFKTHHEVISWLSSGIPLLPTDFNKPVIDTWKRPTALSLGQLCTTMQQKQFPFLRKKRRTKVEDLNSLTLDRNKRLSGIQNSFKTRKLISC